MKRNYVGLACTGHDNALAIINSEGELVFAEGTERYLQNKRAINSPPDDLIRIESLVSSYCEPDAEIVVARTWSDSVHDTFEEEASLAKQRKEGFEGKDGFQLLVGNADIYSYIMGFGSNNIKNAGSHLKYRCDTSLNRKTIFKNYDHHLTHAAAACYTSPYSDAACVIADGFGEGHSTAVYHYKGGEIVTLDTTPMLGNFEKSMGVFYGMLCGLCGFDVWRGEEWKVMGLAPYGKLNERLYELLRTRIQVDKLGLVCPEEGNAVLHELLSYARAPGQNPIEVADVAFTGQKVFSDIMTELLSNVYDLGLSDNLVFSGGCALNSSYNGMILQCTKFKQSYVFCAPGDDGNAVGAAILAYNEDHPTNKYHTDFQSPYLGSHMSMDTLDKVKEFSGLNFTTYDDKEVCKKTAELLAEGKIIGWAQGRAEFGPRALGNRSILADPRFYDMKEKINARVKFREEFRPFAPSILDEFGGEYFEGYVSAPYMERTLKFRESSKEKVAAVAHVDGTGRLQTVREEWNPKYHALIKSFYQRTGVPIVLNTSFNVMGKPIIHSVEDALAVFFTCGLDALVIENTIFVKE